MPIVNSLNVRAFLVIAAGERAASRQRAEARRHIWHISMAAACWVVAFAAVLALNWSGARLTIRAIHSLVQT